MFLVLKVLHHNNEIQPEKEKEKSRVLFGPGWRQVEVCELNDSKIAVDT